MAQHLLADHLPDRSELFIGQQQLEHDAEHLLVGRTGRHGAQHLDQKGLKLAQRIRFIHIDAGQHQMGQRGAHLIPQRKKQLLLVLEVPVDGTTGDPRRLGNIGQTGGRQPPLAKQLQRRCHYATAGLLRLFFCPSNHTEI